MGQLLDIVRNEQGGHASSICGDNFATGGILAV